MMLMHAWVDAASLGYLHRRQCIRARVLQRSMIQQTRWMCQNEAYCDLPLRRGRDCWIHVVHHR